MAVTVDRVAPVAYLPLVLGVVRKLEIATLIDSLIAPLGPFMPSFSYANRKGDIKVVR